MFPIGVPDEAMMQPEANNKNAGKNAPNASSLTQVASSNAGESDSGNTEMTITKDDLPIHREFITESRGHLAMAESKILTLEANPQDAEAIDAIFRCFHTIKGVAGFLNLNQISKLAHTAENLMNPVRKQGILLAPSDIDLILEAIDQMKLLIDALVAAVEHEHPLVDLPGLSEFLQRLENCTQECLRKGTRSDAAGNATMSQPANPAASAEQTVAKKGESAARIADASSPALKYAPAAQAGDANVNVTTERLDALINMVGELVIAQSMISRDVSQLTGGDQRITRNMARLGKITRGLQELSMSMRMVPIQGVFQKMARLARDLSRKAGKQIEFNAIGSETELDRNLVEAISDPLVHMVRNAVDHGIESAQEREAAQKNPVGHIQLKAWQQAGCIVIQLSDDGKGLNKEKILRKAIESGLMEPNIELTEQEIFRLIFRAGLSTAEVLTDISGRGVGMDVVLKNVEKLRGRIEIESVPGRGTTFTVRLPLTLAVIDGLIVAVGEQRFIMPLANIDKSCKVSPRQISTVQGRAEMCLVRDELLPLFHLHRLFNIENAVEDPLKGLVIVVELDQRKCCILVDAIVDQQQVVIKGLGEGFGDMCGVSGGTILGNGNVSLILDVPGIMDLARHQPKLVA